MANGKDVPGDDAFLVALRKYYNNCMKQALGVPAEEEEKNGPAYDRSID